MTETGPRDRNGTPRHVVLVRHGETPWSKAGQFAGLTDIDLTSDGAAAALAARARFMAWQFDRVLVSPLKRARRTAELLGFNGAEVDSRLCERDYGDYEGFTTSEIRAMAPGWNVWLDSVPNGEELSAMAERVDDTIRALSTGAAENVLLVAHAHWIRLFTARWLLLEPRHAALFRLDTLGIVHLGWERDEPVMLAWNR